MTSSTFKLVPPQWVAEPSDTSVGVGDGAVIDCRAEGAPTPTVTWSKETGRNIIYLLKKCKKLKQKRVKNYLDVYMSLL